jgi:heme-degrading monooxygenase HmoA
MPLPRLPHGEPAPSPEDASVTVTVARKVAVGREADFEQWVQGIVEAAAKFPGFLGAGALRPPEAGREWHVVYRFADADKQRAWEESAERAAWLARADEFARQTGTTHVSGLETWFALPGRTAPAPPKWKMAVVTFRRDLPSGAAGQRGAGAADGGLALAVSASCLRRGPCAADDLDCHAAAHPTAAPLALPSIVRVCGSRDGHRGPIVVGLAAGRPDLRVWRELQSPAVGTVARLLPICSV